MAPSSTSLNFSEPQASSVSQQHPDATAGVRHPALEHTFIGCWAQWGQEHPSPCTAAACKTATTVPLSHRAIQESLLASSEGLCPISSESSRFDSDLQLAMELSAKELEEQQLRLREEEAELQQVLQLSLTEK